MRASDGSPAAAPSTDTALHSSTSPGLHHGPGTMLRLVSRIVPSAPIATRTICADVPVPTRTASRPPLASIACEPLPVNVPHGVADGAGQSNALVDHRYWIVLPEE